jgi:hypothetical protein
MEGKDLKIVWTGGPKAKKHTIATIRCVAAKIWTDPQKSVQTRALNTT